MAAYGWLETWRGTGGRVVLVGGLGVVQVAAEGWLEISEVVWWHKGLAGVSG